MAQTAESKSKTGESRNDESNTRRLRRATLTVSTLVAAMLFYNIFVAGLLVYAALALSLSGLGLWPTIALHLAFAFWCMVCLRSNR